MKSFQWMSLMMAGVFMLFFGTGISSAATGTISGTVFGEDGITPVTGDETIRVALFDHDFPHNPIIEVPVNPVDGTYGFKGLSAGEYDLRVLAKNHIDAYWTSAGSVYYRHQLETISLQDGQQLTGIDFQLTPGTALTGTVYATDGTTPIDGALSHIGICAHVKGSCGTRWEFCSQAGSDGTYAIKLPSETLFFSVFSEDYIPEWWAFDASVRDCADAQQIDISEGSPVSDINFQMEKGVTVSGTVFHEDGETPVVGDRMIGVHLVRDNPCQIQGADFVGPINSISGTFSSMVEPGTYYLNISAKNYVDEFWASPASVYSCTDAQMILVEENTPLTGIDFQISAGNIISGTVYESGGTEPVQNQPYLGVEIITQDPCNFHYRSSEYFSFVDTTFGTWFVHVPDGTYYILLNTGSHDTNQFWAELASLRAIDCEQAQSLTVSGNNTYPDINFHIKDVLDTIDLLLNITATDNNGYPIDPETITHEWLFLAPTIRGVNLGIFLYTKDGFKDLETVLAEDPSLTSAAYDFDHSSSDTFSFGKVSLENDLGMVSGDVLMYGYCYTLTDVSELKIGNVVTLNIQKTTPKKETSEYRPVTQRYYPDDYHIEASIWGDVVNAQVINGPDIVSTWDRHAYLANRPDIGDIYTIRLCYDELCNDYEDFEYTITGINDNFAWIDYPADNETINITTPTFTWQAPPGTVDHYRINIHDVTGEKDEFIWGENIPAGQTHFEVPESANLQWGNVYKIYLHSYDENGNQATTVSNFEVLVD